MICLCVLDCMVIGGDWSIFGGVLMKIDHLGSWYIAKPVHGKYQVGLSTFHLQPYRSLLPCIILVMDNGHSWSILRVLCDEPNHSHNRSVAKSNIFSFTDKITKLKSTVHVHVECGIIPWWDSAGITSAPTANQPCRPHLSLKPTSGYFRSLTLQCVSACGPICRSH